MREFQNCFLKGNATTQLTTKQTSPRFPVARGLHSRLAALSESPLLQQERMRRTNSVTEVASLKAP